MPFTNPQDYIEIGSPPNQILIGVEVPTELQAFTDPYFGPYEVVAVMVFYLGSTTDYAWLGMGRPTGASYNLRFVRGAVTSGIGPQVYEEVDCIGGTSGADITLATEYLQQAFLDSDASGIAYRSQYYKDAYTHIRSLTSEDIVAGNVFDYVKTLRQSDGAEIGERMHATYGVVKGGMFGAATLASGVTTTAVALNGGNCNAQGFSLQLAPGHRYRFAARINVASTVAADRCSIDLHWGPLGTVADPNVARSFNDYLPIAAENASSEVECVFSVPTYNAGYKGTVSVVRTHGTGTLTAASFSDNPSYFIIENLGRTENGAWIDTNS